MLVHMKGPIISHCKYAHHGFLPSIHVVSVFPNQATRAEAFSMSDAVQPEAKAFQHGREPRALSGKAPIPAPPQQESAAGAGNTGRRWGAFPQAVLLKGVEARQFLMLR